MAGGKNIMVCGLSWRCLDLDVTLGSRNLAKGKKRKKERARSASDKVGSGSEERM